MKISVSLDPSMGRNMPAYLGELNLIRNIIVHCDVMDGVFVPRKNMEKTDFHYILLLSVRPVDVHLMVSDPASWIQGMKEKSAESVSVHVEGASSSQEVRRLLRKIRGKGMKAGIVIDLSTAVTENIVNLLSECDVVTIMSVQAGQSGQTFNESALEKVKIIKKFAPRVRVIMDGGINAENLPQVKAAGVDTAVIGSAIYGAEDRRAEIQKLISMLN